MTLTLTEKRAKALADAQKIVDDAADRDLTDGEKADVDGLLTDVRDLDEKIAACAEDEARLAALKSLKPTPVPPPAGVPAASGLGDHFVGHVKDRLAGVAGSRFALAAPDWMKDSTPTVTTGLDRTQYGGVVTLPLERPTIADLLLSGTVTGNSWTYFQEGPVSGAPAPTSESTTKPEVKGQFTQVTEALTKIAGWSKESDELIEDFAALASVVSARLVRRLRLAEESQLLVGNGSPPNLKGILTRDVQTESQAASGDSAADAIFRAITKVQTATFLPADFIVINPADYQKLRLAKDGNDQYYGGGFFTGAYGAGGIPSVPSLWGLRTVVTSSISAKTVLVGSGQAAQVFRKGGIRVEMTNTDQDDFITNRVTLRAEERLLLAVYQPSAFVNVTLQ